MSEDKLNTYAIGFLLGTLVAKNILGFLDYLFIVLGAAIVYLIEMGIKDFMKGKRRS